MKQLWHFMDELPQDERIKLKDIHDDQNLTDFVLEQSKEDIVPPYIPIKILHYCYWNSRPDLIRSILEQYAQRKLIQNEELPVCYQLLRLSELSGSDSFLTEDTLSGLEEKFAALGKPLYRSILERMRFGISLRERHMTASIVSLGQDCLPWDLLNRWYVRSPSELDKIEGPFDLAAHGPRALASLIPSAFSGYTDISNYTFIATATGQKVAVHSPTASVFNHHLSNYWFKNDCAALLAFLEARVKTLKEGFASSSLMYLYHSRTIRSADAAKALLEELTSSAASGFCLANFPVVILNTDPSIQPDRQRLSDNWTFVAVPRPNSAYIWHQPESFSAPEGVQFERQVIDVVIGAKEQFIR